MYVQTFSSFEKNWSKLDDGIFNQHFNVTRMYTKTTRAEKIALCKFFMRNAAGGNRKTLLNLKVSLCVRREMNEQFFI